MLYLAVAGIYHEGSGPIGILSSLAEAMAYAEDDCDRYGYEPYADIYWDVQVWDTDQQKCVKLYHYDRQSKTWHYYDSETRTDIPFKP